MGGSNSKSSGSTLPGPHTAIYRVLLDNQINMRVIVILHGSPLLASSLSQLMMTSDGACAKCGRGMEGGLGGLTASMRLESPVHVFPLAPKLDDSVPVPLALPFQYQANYIAGFRDAWDTAVLVSVFTVVTIEGAEYIDGYIYINQPLPNLPEHLVNPAVLTVPHTKKHEKKYKKRLSAEMTPAAAASAGATTVPIGGAQNMTGAPMATGTGTGTGMGTGIGNIMRIQITPSDLARRCKFDQPISQLPFLAMLNTVPLEPSSTTAGPSEPVVPTGAGLGVFRPNLAPSLRML